jgi:hypothetical protein
MPYSDEVKSAFAADPSDPRHGTVKGYTNLKCRCRPCTEANGAKHRLQRKQDQLSGHGVPLLRSESWMAEGACRNGDADWFPERGSHLGELRRICAGCPVRVRCLEYALEWNERFGCWGGHSERQRRELKRAGTSAQVAMERFDAWMARRPERLPPGPDHRPGWPVSDGSYARGCRCRACTRAHRDDQVVRRMERSEGLAS